MSVRCIFLSLLKCPVAVNNNTHIGSSPIPNNCLGCLCGGGSHENPNYNFSRTYNFTSRGTIT